MKTWTCRGLKSVTANTRSEARALFKEQLQELERLTFHPRRLLRLPPEYLVVEENYTPRCSRSV